MAEAELGFSSRDYSNLIGPSKGVGLRIWFGLKFRRLCQLCLVTPLLGLVACVVIAVLFQFEHIHETACQVYNVVPSISAVTGISPGRYLWRLSVALHLGPRLLVVTVYFHFLLALIDSACKANKGSNQEEAELTRMMKAIFYLQILEIIGLCGISFIHNREHYYIHEKSFIVYISTSHLSFILVLRIYKRVWSHLTESQRKSFYKRLFSCSFSFFCLILMAYFYFRHIVYCDNLAFSIFAFAEYFVVAANMYFYWSILDDLPEEEVVVLRPHEAVEVVNGGDLKKNT